MFSLNKKIIIKKKIQKDKIGLRDNKPCNQCVVEEYPGMNPSCYALCYELFATNTRTWSKHASDSCQIGCGYREKAIQEFDKNISKAASLAQRIQNSSGECLMSCKETVFGYENDGKCNLSNGLGILINLRGFNAEMACEIGCLIGGERLCPLCNPLA